MMWVFTSVFIVAVEALSLANLATSFLKRKPRDKWDAVKFALYLLGTTTILSNEIFSNQAIKTVANIVVCFIFIALYYQSSNLGKLGVATVSLAIVYYTDYMILILARMVLHIEQREVMENIELFILISFTSKFVLYIVTFVIRFAKEDTKSPATIMLSDWAKLLLFPVFSLVTMAILAEVSLKRLANLNLIFFDAIGLIVANIIILNMIRNVEEKNKTKQENLLLEQRVKLEVNNWQAMEESYAEQRKMTHDFTNHLDTIYSLLDSGEPQKIKEYIQSLGGEISSHSAVINSNNHIVDAILNQKYYKALNKGITVDFIVNDLSKLALPAENVVTILSNAFDNAIEAAQESKEKLIRIKIIKDESSTAIAFQNTVDKKVSIELDEVKTSKKDSINHGYGIKNIKSTLSKYDSIFDISCDDKWFKLSIVINQ